LNQLLKDKIKDHLAWPVLGRVPTPEEESLRFLTLALCGEAGELANLIKKDWRGDQGGEERRAKIVDELTDVANYTFMIAARLGVDLETLMLKKFEIVEKRLEWTRRNT
jgi:NTP pyrophosphatase (non-canonical NTP hydrolase)